MIINNVLITLSHRKKNCHEDGWTVG